jgi:hypothetical protein
MEASEAILRYEGAGWVLTIENPYYPRVFMMDKISGEKLNWSANAYLFSVELPEDLLQTIIDNAEEIKKALIPINNR